MTWRRIAPWVIGAIALVAIFIDLPRTTLGLSWLPDEFGAEFRTVLGLDLQGGLQRHARGAAAGRRAEVTDEQIETGARHHRAARRRHRGDRAAGPHRDRRRRFAADRGRGARRQRRAARCATSSARPASSSSSTRRARQPHRRAGHQRPPRGGHGQRAVRRGRDPARAASLPTSARATRSASQFTLSDEAARPGASSRRRTSEQPGPIALDGEVITTPTIHEPICGGTTIITVGAATPANEVERTNLYNTLRFGALPVSLTEQGVRDGRSDARRRLPDPGARRRRASACCSSSSS